MNMLTGRLRLDFRSNDPLYLQIVRQVADLVRAGVLQPGDQLPTVRELAIDLRINFSTVSRAYRLLDKQRLISTQRGRGTYIETDAVELAGVATMGEPGEVTVHEPEKGHLSGDAREEKLEMICRRAYAEARQLGFTPEEFQAAMKDHLLRNQVLRNEGSSLSNDNKRKDEQEK